MSADTPDFLHPIGYSVLKRAALKFPFPGLENIQINYSQLHQDMAVLTLLNGKREGWYLEIGAHEPLFLSNTYLLENTFGWRGIGLEIHPELAARHRLYRHNPCLVADATRADYADLLQQHTFPNIIDYLSVDIEPPRFTWEALQRIPHDDYRFRVITFEHDFSAGGARERELSRAFLSSLGYELLINDVSWKDYIVEDWWIDPELVDQEISRGLRCSAETQHQHDRILYQIAQPTSAEPDGDEGSSSDQIERRDLCVEGWLDLNHSYSLVNQWQLLALLEKPLRLCHRDIALYSSNWTKEKNSSGLPDTLTKRLAAIEQPKPGMQFDCVYRIGFPLDFTPTDKARLFVFGTTEYGLIDEMIKGASLEAAISNDNLQIITPSQWSREGFLHSGFAEDRVHVVPHAAAAEVFYRVDDELRSFYRQIFGFTPEDQVLLNLGVLTTNKGVDTLLKAYTILKPRYPHLKLVIKSQSDLYTRNLNTVMAEMLFQAQGPIPDPDDSQDIITLDSNLDLDTLRALYNACDLYVSPYRAEGFNLPALEAAACGCPILVTAGGSSDDYFSPKLGLQISSEQVHWQQLRALNPSLDSLIAGIETMLSKPGAWGGEQGSAWIHQHFSWQQACGKLLDAMGIG